MRSLVALTPDDLSVQALYRAPAGFRRAFDALRRSYRYRIAAIRRPPGPRLGPRLVVPRRAG